MSKFSIITPCFNAERHIADTVESVLTQTAVLSGRIELDYIICDGNSADRTLEIAEQTVEKCGGYPVRILSGNDSGMYDALAKGLRMASGEICGYINSGDFYSRNAFDIALDVFRQCQPEWITGINCHSNEGSQITATFPPFRYRRSLVRSGYYGRSLPFIQQESTFWKAELNSRVDLDRLARFRYAGDYYLWLCFAQVAELKMVETILGSFRIHAGQLSENRAGYLAEVAKIAEKPGSSDRILAGYDRIMRNMPPRLQRILGWPNSIFFDHDTQQWRDRIR